MTVTPLKSGGVKPSDGGVPATASIAPPPGRLTRRNA